MTLASLIFGTETRVRPLLKALIIVIALRVGWLTINSYAPLPLVLIFVLIHWPPHWFSWTVWIVDLALVLYQLRTEARLVRLLLLRYAPQVATFLGFSSRPPGDGKRLTPRHRSWWPTALLLSGILILSCCALPWIVLTLSTKQPIPFDRFMTSAIADKAMLVGIALSALGLTFGGRYIARAAGDVSTQFKVTQVDDSHWLAGRVHRLAERLNLPKPAVGVTNVMNAFAMGANQKTSMVVIGQPLFAFEPDELDAIIGHELGHVLHNDVARMQFAEGFQRMLSTTINVLTIVGAITASVSSKGRGDAHRNARLTLGSGRLVRKTVFIGSELVVKGISRNREFHADLVGAHVTSPDAMARALKRIHGVADMPTAEERHYGYLMFRGAAFGRFFATHPTLKARLAALDAHAASRVETLATGH